MKAGNWHISKNGEPGPCSAPPGKCPLGGEHGSYEQIERVTQAKFEEKHGKFQTFGKRPTRTTAASAPRKITQAQKKEIKSLVNRSTEDFANYYAATDKKHFGDRTEPGSKFTDTKLRRLEDLAALAINQRGNLDGEDKEEFMKLGADESAFNPNNRYIMVKTSGTVGIKNTADMKGSDLVEVVRTKPGVPCSIVATVKEQETSNVAVMVLTTNRDTGKPMLITAFPGPVTKQIKSDELDKFEGQKITVAQAREILGEDVYANTKISD